MRSFLRAAGADLNRYLDQNATSVWGKISAIRRNEGLQAVLVYRFGRLLLSKRNLVSLWPFLGVGWCVYALLALVARKGYGIDVSLSADIGAGFWIGHFGGIEMVNCRLAERCSVGQQTKVGRAGQIDGPEIGDSVWIGAHAKIFGPVKVGDRATIAPGARVAKDVPSYSLIVGDPGRIVSRRYDNSLILPRIGPEVVSRQVGKKVA
jgi:serine O-acetyltransferase